MKYFTMEELDYITKEILENPSKETLKKLNEKYNGVEESSNNMNWVESSANSPVKIEQESKESKEPKVTNNIQETNSIASSFNVPSFELTPNKEVVEIKSPINDTFPNTPLAVEELKVETPVWEPISSNADNTLFNANTPNNNGLPSQSTDIIDISNLNTEKKPQNNTFELPKIEPTSNISKISEIQPTNPTNNQVPFNGNLWENKTNKTNNMMQTTDNFNSTIEVRPDNEILLGQTPFFQTVPSSTNNSIPISEQPVMEGPTMFGQFEQNFNNNAA